MRQAILDSWNDRLLRLAFLCILLMGTAVASVIPYQSIIGVERLGIPATGYALITTLGALVSVMASVSVGIYSDQTGRYRTVLTACIAVGIVAGLCMYLAPAKASFVLVHVLLLPIASTSFTQYFALASLAAKSNTTLNKDFSLSLVRAAFAASFGLTPPVWAVAVASGVDLFSVYGFVALVNLVVLVLVLTSWPSKPRAAESTQSGISFWQSLKELGQPRILSRVILIAIIVGVNGLYNILLGLLVLNNLGGSESDVGWFAGGVALVEVPIMLLMAAALRYVSKSSLILIGVCIYTGFFIVLGALPSMSAAWWLIIPAGIGAGILLSVTVGYVQELVAHRPGAGSSLAAVAHFSGMIFASSVLAVGTTITDYAGTAWIGASIGLAAGLVLFLLDKHTAQQKSPGVGPGL